MKKEIVESYLGKKVEIEFFTDEIIQGELHKTGVDRFKNDPNLFIPKNYYFVIYSRNGNISFLFRSSHIKKIKEVE